MQFQPSTLTTVPTDWARVDAAVDELLCLPPEDWPAAIERLSQGDAAMADELHTLLDTALEGHRQYGVRAHGDEAAAPRWRDLDKETLGMAAQLRAALDEATEPVPSRPHAAVAPRPAPPAARTSGAGTPWRAAGAVLAGLVGAWLVHWLLD